MTAADLMDDELLTPSEAFSWLKIGKTLGYQLMARGELPYIQVGGRRRIPRRALAEYLQERLVGRPTGARPDPLRPAASR